MISGSPASSLARAGLHRRDRADLTNRNFYETQNYFESRVASGDPVVQRIHATPGYPLSVMAGITMRFGGNQGFLHWGLSEALVLFDIDGTLVRRAGPHHRQALVDAVRQVTGLETTTDGIPVHGMLDPDILARMMTASGLDEGAIRAAMPAIIEAAQDLYQESVPDLRDKHCPGVGPLLERLQGQGIVLALVTGNLTRIGWRKLERAGLDRYFRFGAFGEMAPTRGGLARLAIEQARREGLICEGTRISLVGDAPQDVMAARENGIRSIAVRTGITPPGELEACAPDLLLGDLTELGVGSL